MRLSAASITVGTVAMCFYASALADWQYTEWGMTLDQVIEASAGNAVEFSDSDRNTDTAEAKATAPYVAGEFVFEATFMFDKKTRRLSRIMLTLKEGDGRSLYGALVNRYGKPVSESRDSLTPSAKWRDPQNNNAVYWFMIGSAYTSLEYSALVGETETGL